MIPTYAERAQSDVRMEVSMTVNGSLRTLKVEPRITLLDALRDELGLTGPKKSCDRGECGACTVHIDGRRILSCMTLAAMHDRQLITTVEGLESNGRLHAVQDMFIEHDGFQCGFCTSGQIMSAVTVIEEAAAGWPSAGSEGVRSAREGPSDHDREAVVTRDAVFPSGMNASSGTCHRVHHNDEANTFGY